MPTFLSRALVVGVVIALMPICLSHVGQIPAADLGQLAFLGTPKIDTYLARESGITGNIHAIAQLPGGEIAVITSRGVFSFDGTQWSELESGQIIWPSCSIRLSEDSSAIGFKRGIVEIRPDGKGSYSQRYLPHLDEDNNGHPIRNLERARGRLLALKGSDLLAIGPDERVSVYSQPTWPLDLFSIGDEVYLLGGLPNSYLNRWDWDKQELVGANEMLKDSLEDELVEAEPRSEGGVWIRNIENQIIGFDGTRSWIWLGNQTLAEHSVHITCHVETKPGELAIGTAKQGVLFFDRSGRLIKKVGKEDGLSDANAKRIGIDDQDGLWVASRRGVARIDLNFDTLLFDEQHRITDSVNTIEIFDGKLYVGTASGLFVSGTNPKKKSETFTLVDDSLGVTDMLAYDDHLFISTPNVMAMDKQRNFTLVSSNSGSNIFHPTRFPDLILACGYQGVQRIERRNGEWLAGPFLSGDCPEVYSIAETEDGELWGGLSTPSLARIRLDDTSGSIEQVPLENSNLEGWPDVLSVDGEVYVGSDPVIRWDATSQKFVEDQKMQKYPGGKPYGFREVIGLTPDEAFVPASARRSKTYPKPNRRILGSISNVGATIETRAECIVYDDDGNAWIGGGFGILLARSPLAEVAPIHEIPRIHKLTSTKDGAALPVGATRDSPLVLQPWQDSLVIQVELRDFASARNTQYRICLQGFDAEPSDFSAASMREITNLAPGDYHLQVTAKCADGQTSETLDIPITLLAHWFERPWAYALYVSGLVIIVFAIVKRNARRHERRSLELEKTIARRTQEVEGKNKKLEQQAETLERRNLELAEKSEELEQTTLSLTETLHTLQQTQDQLLATARTAGKAEIATNVLHNVGNVLNSVNVNLTSLSSKVGNSNVSRLSKLAQLIESQQHDIENFLTEDRRGKAVPEFIIHMARVLQDEIGAMGDLIETIDSDVSHIKRIVAAQQTYAKSVGVIQAFNLSELCSAAISIADTKDYASAIEIVNDLPGNLMLQNDKERILEILLNLISNARHAILDQKPERGLITISAKNVDNDKCIAITITDNGVGFDEALKSNLFQHGFTTKKDGHGFGLHASANAASALGGRLSLDSPGPGKGATATLTLPHASAT